MTSTAVWLRSAQKTNHLRAVWNGAQAAQIDGSCLIGRAHCARTFSGNDGAQSFAASLVGKAAVAFDRVHAHQLVTHGPAREVP